MNNLIRFDQTECKIHLCCPEKVKQVFQDSRYKDFFSYIESDNGSMEFTIKKQEFRDYFYKETGFALSFSNKAKESRKSFLQKIHKNRAVFSLVDMHDFFVHILPFFKNAKLYKKMICEKISNESNLTNKAVIWEMMGAFICATNLANNNECFGMFSWRSDEYRVELRKIFPQNKNIMIERDYQNNPVPYENRQTYDTLHSLALAPISNCLFDKYLDEYNQGSLNLE